MYRPPGTDIDSFNNIVHDFLGNLNKEKGKTILIAGDFNIDLLKHDVHGPTNDFINNMFAHSYVPVINIATRITDHTSSLIDNIFVRCNNNNYRSAVVYADISDHFPVIVQLSVLAKNIARNDTTVTKRFYDDKSLHNFNLQLSAPDVWNEVYKVINNGGNSNDAMTEFYKVHNEAFESCFPEKIVRRSKKRTPRHDWITKGLISSYKKKNILFKKYRKTNLPL